MLDPEGLVTICVSFFALSIMLAWLYLMSRRKWERLRSAVESGYRHSIERWRRDLEAVMLTIKADAEIPDEMCKVVPLAIEYMKNLNTSFVQMRQARDDLDNKLAADIKRIYEEHREKIDLLCDASGINARFPERSYEARFGLLLKLLKKAETARGNIESVENSVNKALRVLADQNGIEAILGQTPPMKLEKLAELAIKERLQRAEESAELNQVRERLVQILRCHGIESNSGHETRHLAATVTEIDMNWRRWVSNVSRFLQGLSQDLHDMGYAPRSPEEVDDGDPREFEPDPADRRTVRGGEDAVELPEGRMVTIRGQGHVVLPTDDPKMLDGFITGRGECSPPEMIGGIGSWRDDK